MILVIKHNPAPFSELVISTIAKGYKIPFYREPPPCILENNKSAISDKKFVAEELQKLLLTGRIRKIYGIPKFVNPLSVATRNDKKRLIIDLRHVNYFVYKQKVKFEDWSTFENLIDKQGFAFTFDIKSGYHHIDIFPEHQEYL